MTEKRDSYDHHGIVGPLLLIAIGGLLLASRMGMAIDFIAILRMWPLVLIAIGIDMLIGRRSVLGAVVSAAAIIAMFAGGFWLFGVTDMTNLETEDFVVEMGDFDQMDLTLEPAVGQLDVDAMTGESQNALEAVLSTVIGESVDAHTRENNGVQAVSIRAEGMWTGWNTTRSTGHPGWEIDLNPALQYDLDVDMGVGQLDLDLTGIDLEELNIEMGIGQTLLRLPEGDYRALVDAAIGELVVYIPQNHSVRITADTGIAGLDLPAGFTRSGDSYLSPDFEDDSDVLDLFLGQAIGSLRVVYLP